MRSFKNTSTSTSSPWSSMNTASEAIRPFDLLPLTLCREGIDWTGIDWVDNAECLNLIERVSPW